ncbi:polysaccharide deacetylase family protein [Roseobacter sp. YSTF-M11]|uniref:Polysaccharide deacetylase family protein n=1 Tax=Roseobacter insulae TaxID=2859783 RepID=A0A9X1JZF4_9RHOB|nr:polysaccharide deacetylase family protein [Roseobacter insulae]MBW4707129.1 polysaccharide deacetylase family protein [Roseobacter insulae]
MIPDWRPLRQELARLRAANIELPIWWRDDDAIAATPQLDQLAQLSGDLGVSTHLAVIPARATPTLAAAVTTLPNVIPVAHGWTHENRAPAGEKKAEFGHGRADATFDLERGFSQMRQMFGKRFVPVFVAPWNRLNAMYFQPLSDVGYKAVSTFTPRNSAEAVPGLITVNTHIDPIDWRGTRGLVAPDAIIAEAARHLEARRLGASDPAEPFGYLTHHLVHTPEIWDFTRAFLSELLAGGARETSLQTVIEESQ